MDRKPISIGAVPETDNFHTQLFALCDDGTIWTNYFNRSLDKWDKWTELPPIPQLESLFE